jgi:hypothetical protein
MRSIYPKGSCQFRQYKQLSFWHDGVDCDLCCKDGVFRNSTHISGVPAFGHLHYNNEPQVAATSFFTYRIDLRIRRNFGVAVIYRMRKSWADLHQLLHQISRASELVFVQILWQSRSIQVDHLRQPSADLDMSALRNCAKYMLLLWFDPDPQ